MKLRTLAAPLALAFVLAACGDDDDNGDENTAPDFSTSAGIIAYLSGVNSISVDGADLVAPNGAALDSNPLFCITGTDLDVAATGEFTVTSPAGTFSAGPDADPLTIEDNECDTTVAAGATAMFTSDGPAQITNVSADGSCFDIVLDFTSNGFTQVGRASITDTSLTLETYFQVNAPSGATCADGNPGEGMVTLTVNTVAVTVPASLALQPYSVTP
ncbi:MAG: hypothetical protein AAF654_05535 [Myxococcota bacterium]